MRRYLVVANQTATGPELRRAIAECMSEGECEFHLVVPATAPRDMATWTEGTAHGVAHRRLLEAIEQLRVAGANVDGWVGDASPYLAIADALRDRTVDEVILSTFHQTLSRWLRMDVASRVQRDFGVPVRVVESMRSPVRAGQAPRV